MLVSVGSVSTASDATAYADKLIDNFTKSLLGANATKNGADGADKDGDIEPEAPVLDVVNVESSTFFKVDVASA